MNFNAIVITDDVAENIGELCVMLKNSTGQLLEQFGLTKDDINVNNATYCHDAVNKQNISEKLALVNSKSFLCCWYGHGKDKSFRINGENVVTTTDNYYIFSNALIYTLSCLNGGTLADVLIDNNAKTFVGYCGNVNCPYGIDDVTCDIAMSFLSSFLGGKSVSDAVDDLKSSYEDAVFNKDLEPFQRLQFQENRDNVTLKGDGTITINDLLVA